MIRISTTTLESFRRLIDTEWGDERELISSIRGERTPATWQMEAGSAWDAALEGDDGRLRTFDADGLLYVGWSEFFFQEADVLMAREYRGPGIPQVKATRLFDVEGYQVTLVGQTDLVYGLAVQEDKAKFTTADARDYEASLQWRCYLLCHEAACVRYNLWSFSEPKKGYCELRDVLSVRFWPYAGLEGEIRGWLGQFVNWAAAKGLLGYLAREGSTPMYEAA